MIRSIISNRDLLKVYSVQGRLISTTIWDLVDNLQNAKRATPDAHRWLAELKEEYVNFSVDDKSKFLSTLASRDSLTHQLEALRNINLHTPSKAELNRFRRQLEPCHQKLSITVAREGGLDFLLDMRADTINLIKNMQSVAHDREQLSDLKALNDSLKFLIDLSFPVNFLELRRLTYETTSGKLLEAIARKEAVHPVRSLTDLKARLGPNRRCFAFFHPSLKDTPLVFIHVALLPEIAHSMKYIHDVTSDPTIDEQKHAKAAIFYSINATQKGLSGIDLSNLLIKSVVNQLRSEFPEMRIFCTLSPVPGFLQWLETRALHNSAMDPHSKFKHTLLTSEERVSVVEASHILLDSGMSFAESPACVTEEVLLVNILKETAWHTLPHVQNLLKPLLMRAMYHYLVLEKRRAHALDPVANFHLSNGAVLHRINWMADPSSKGLHRSAGMMVNYNYVIEDIAENSDCYIRSGQIPLSDELHSIS